MDQSYKLDTAATFEALYGTVPYGNSDPADYSYYALGQIGAGLTTVGKTQGSTAVAGCCQSDGLYLDTYIDRQDYEIELIATLWFDIGAHSGRTYVGINAKDSGWSTVHLMFSSNSGTIEVAMYYYDSSKGSVTMVALSTLGFTQGQVPYVVTSGYLLEVRLKLIVMRFGNDVAISGYAFLNDLLGSNTKTLDSGRSYVTHNGNNIKGWTTGYITPYIGIRRWTDAFIFLEKVTLQ